MIEPFVLKDRHVFAPEPAADPSESYDSVRQIWVNAKTGVPVVERLRTAGGSTPFGETVTTESREGADQSEITSITASQFGETMMTKSQEGHDQTGESATMSNVGETTNTYTREGVDSTEVSALVHATYSHL